MHLSGEAWWEQPRPMCPDGWGSSSPWPFGIFLHSEMPLSHHQDPIYIELLPPSQGFIHSFQQIFTECFLLPGTVLGVGKLLTFFLLSGGDKWWTNECVAPVKHQKSLESKAGERERSGEEGWDATKDMVAREGHSHRKHLCRDPDEVLGSHAGRVKAWR